MSVDRLVAEPTTRVLAALLHVQERDGRATVRSVADVAGRSQSTTHGHLVELRELGLVSWAEGTRGTLRSCVEPMRFRAAHARRRRRT